MSLWQVNATVTMPAWITVEAETREGALDAARELSAANYDTDTSAAQVEFNVSPSVEPTV